MKTLSFIAYKQPVTQSYLAKVRGNLSYSHVKHLQEMGLISEEKLGRTKILRTTPNFADYFNLSQDLQIMKKQLERIFEDIKLEKYSNKQTITSNSIENANFSNKLEDGSITGWIRMVMVEFNKLKETVDIFIPRTTEGASITLTMTAEKAKQLYQLLQKALSENDQLPKWISEYNNTYERPLACQLNLQEIA